MSVQIDLFVALAAADTPICGECHQLDPKALDSGVRYCWGEMSWRGPAERVIGCAYRDKPCARVEYAKTTRPEALRDLLDDPRHTLTPKARRELAKELREAAA